MVPTRLRPGARTARESALMGYVAFRRFRPEKRSSAPPLRGNPRAAIESRVGVHRGFGRSGVAVRGEGQQNDLGEALRRQAAAQARPEVGGGHPVESGAAVGHAVREGGRKIQQERGVRGSDLDLELDAGKGRLSPVPEEVQVFSLLMALDEVGDPVAIGIESRREGRRRRSEARRPTGANVRESDRDSRTRSRARSSRRSSGRKGVGSRKPRESWPVRATPRQRSARSARNPLRAP